MMKMKNKLVILSVTILCLGAGSVKADMWLSLDDGTTTVSIQDDGAGDTMNSIPGWISFSGSIGDLWLSGTMGFSKPIIGTANEAKLHLDNVSVGGAGTLTITLTDTGFDLTHKTPDTTSMLSEFSTVTDGTISYTQRFDPVTGDSVELTGGPFVMGSFEESQTATVPIGTVFSLTEIVVISHERAGDITSFDIESTVPVPGAVLLGFLGLTAAGIRLRKYA